MGVGAIQFKAGNGHTTEGGYGHSIDGGMDTQLRREEHTIEGEMDTKLGGGECHTFLWGGQTRI